MSDTPDGLGLDVNSDAGFTAALAGLAGAEALPEEVLEPLIQGDTSIAAGLTTEESVRRDDLGRFTPAAENEDGGAAPAAQDEQEGGTEDPWAGVPDHVREEFERTKRERDEAQSLIGRQGNELGTLRERLAKIEGRLEATPQPTQQAPIVTSQDVEHVENLVAERGGQAAMAWAAQNAPHLIDATLTAWEAEEPVAAARFAVRYEQNLLEQARQKEAEGKEAQPQDDPVYASARERYVMEQRNASYTEALQTLGVTNDQLVALEPQIGAVLKSSPMLEQGVLSEDHKTRVESFKLLVQLAKSDAAAAPPAPASTERQAAVTASKKAARVASGSMRPVERRQPAAGDEVAPEDKAEAIQAFHQKILTAETTSVADGLTFAK